MSGSLSSTETSTTGGSLTTSLFSSIYTDPAASSTLSTPTPASTPADGGGGGGGGDSLQSSAALYLYTFLATLILLLGVSAAIVIRSLVLRRRHRRMIEEAIANGTWVPPPPRNRFDPAKKPVMHEAHIRIDDKQALLDSWDVLKPVSASYTVAPSWIPRSTPATNVNGTAASVLPERPAFFGRLFQRRAPASPAPTVEASPAPSIPMSAMASSSTTNITSALPNMNVSVLIVMPHEKDDADESLPLIEVGVAEVPVQTDENRNGSAGKNVDTSE